MSILLYDNSFEGLLTCIYNAFYSKSDIEGIYSKSDFNAPLLLGEIINIDTDIIKFQKVRNAIVNKIDFLCLKKIYLVYLSCNENKGMIIFKYLQYAFKLKREIHDFLHLNEVHKIEEIQKKVTYEAHVFKGFIRFKSINNLFLYSSIEPDNDILELIANHFMKRFPNEYWIIHDLSREKALVYNTSSYEIIKLSKNEYSKFTKYNDEYSSLWKTYFKSTTIEERRNPRLQKRMMPQRYWKHIFETKN